MKRLLFIAFHFPPMTHSSGVQRSLRFVKYLRYAGWEPLVLTARPMAYVSVGDEQVADIPPGLLVERAFALDAARHLSIAGRFPRFLAQPDRWSSWRPFAVHLGQRMIRQYQPDAIFSTYPIATAHEIAYQLARWSGLPWVADFRDSIFDDEYPADPRQRAIHEAIDRRAAEACAKAIFTAHSARRMYLARYPELPESRWTVIPNGYDEADFAGLKAADPCPEQGKRVLLLHSGVLYPIERDPLPFFKALRTLKTAGVVEPGKLLIRLRGTAHDPHYADVLHDLDLNDLVELMAPLPYREALAEMTQADGLLLFQAAGCNHQVPAKLYEYLRAQRPIIALTDDQGDTAAELREAVADNLLPLDDEGAIVRRFPELMRQLEQGQLKTAPLNRVVTYSRARGAERLAVILEELTLGD